MELKVCALKIKDESSRAESQSGGAFSAFADVILEQGGVVYGCVLKDNRIAMHDRASTKDECNKFRGSKYIQSNMGDTFIRVKKDLENGLLVLFSGTSCQVQGLKAFLGKTYDNLYCLDIICHGVPSAKIWNSYLDWLEKKNKSKIQEAVFRNTKKYGWHSHYETFKFENGKEYDANRFAALFYSENIVRPSCFECPYKSIHHDSDITIGDYWGIENVIPEYDDNKGVSIVLINSQKGDKWFESAKDKTIWMYTEIEKALQPPLVSPFPKPNSRNTFWRDYNKFGFEYILRKYTSYGIWYRIKRKIKYILNKQRK